MKPSPKIPLHYEQPDPSVSFRNLICASGIMYSLKTMPAIITALWKLSSVQNSNTASPPITTPTP